MQPTPERKEKAARITLLLPKGEDIPPARIDDPMDGDTVPRTFTARGTFENSASVLTAKIEKGSYSQTPKVTPDKGKLLWSATFTDVPCDTNYALSITGTAETGHTIFMNVCAGLRSIMYVRSAPERLIISSPADAILKSSSASKGAKPEAGKQPAAPKKYVKTPITVTVTFYPDQKDPSGQAVNKSTGKPYEASVVKSGKKSLDPFKSQSYDFTFDDLSPGEYTLTFMGGEITVQTEVEVNPDKA